MTISREELHSYRLSSLEEPTDEMLQAIMEQMAEAARQSTAKCEAEIYRRIEQIRDKNDAKTDTMCNRGS